MTTQKIKPIFTKYFINKYIRKEAYKILSDTTFNRIFITTYHTPVNSHFELAINEQSLAHTEYVFSKDITSNLDLYRYVYLKLLGDTALNDFTRLAYNHDNSIFIINDTELYYPDMINFLKAANIKAWTYRQLYNKNHINIAAVHFTKSNQIDITKKEFEYVDYLYDICQLYLSKKE